MRVAGSKEGKPPCAWEDEIRRRECEDFAPRNGATRVSGERGAKRKSRRAPGRSKSDGGNVKILLPGTELQGFAGSGEQREGAAGWPRGRSRRRECEDFAPRNGATRVSGERGAKRGHRRATARAKSGGGNVKILLPGTELQGFAGSGEQREGAAVCPAGHPPGLAQEYVQEKTCIFIHNHVLSYQRH